MSGSGQEGAIKPPRRNGYLGQTIRTLAFHDTELKRCSYKDPMTGAWKGRWVESKYPAYSVWTYGLDGWRHYIHRTIDKSCSKENTGPKSLKNSGKRKQATTSGSRRNGKKGQTNLRGSGGSQVKNDLNLKRIVRRRKGQIQELPEK